MVCSDKGCEREARVALRTTRPTRPDLRTLIYWDDRVAPKTAARYCREHGIATIKALSETLIDQDEEIIVAS